MTPVDRARQLMGAPFIHLGRNASGIDCIGLLAYAHDYPMEKIPVYPRDPLNDQLVNGLDHVLGSPIRLCPHGCRPGVLRPGDIVAIAFARYTRHVALVAQHPVYADLLSMIHTDSTIGRVVEHTLDEKWLRRIRRVYRP